MTAGLCRLVLKPMQPTTKRENSSEPQKKADQKRGDGIEHPGPVEALLQYGGEQWLGDGLVVRDVERAPENLRDHRRQRREQKPVTGAKRACFNCSSHRVDALLSSNLCALSPKSQRPASRLPVRILRIEMFDLQDHVV